MKNATSLPYGFVDRVSQFLVVAPRHCDDVIAGCNQPPGYGKPDAAAASGDQNIMHRAGPAFLPP